jgi:endonuclease/exonuclease/phosphatase family metal-dependent hydrolase
MPPRYRAPPVARLCDDAGVRVVTWNLWWRFGDWSRRRQAILTVLRDLRPDLCALQEVWADATTNQAAWLADELGLHHTWGPVSAQERWQRRIGDSTVQFGAALLSRWPLEDPRFEDLPGDPARPLVSALVRAPHAVVPFVTAHLTATGGHSRIRTTQVERVVQVTGERLTPDHPPIVAGDFNAQPDSDEIRLLSGDRTRQVVDGLVLLDAWDFAEPDARGFTWDRRNPYAALGPDPSMRIDYLRVGLRYDLAAGRVRSVRLAGTGAVDGVWPSDHAAVVADLSERPDQPEQ